MLIVKFVYKQKGITLAGILITIFTLVVLSDVELPFNKYWAYFLMTTSYFVSSFIISKRITKGVKEIDVTEDKWKMVFFNTFKEDLDTSLQEIETIIENDMLKIKRRTDGKLLAVAYKDLIVDLNDWELLLGKLI